MEAVIDFIGEGVRNFAGEIIGGIMFAVALWAFPGLRKFFGRDKELGNDESEIHKQLELLQNKERQIADMKEVLKLHEEILERTEAETLESSHRREEIQREIDSQLREEERVKAEIERRQELLREAEARKAEEEKQKLEIQRRLEEQRREEERIKAEIERKKEELKRAEAKRDDEARLRDEAQRQLEAMQKSSGEQNYYETSIRHSINVIFAVVLILAICIFGKFCYDHFANRTRKAAEQGHIPSQLYLALIYEHGEGVAVNLDEARKWYQLAAQSGNTYAQEALTRLQ